jgi:PAS domain S-box-containing protein
MFKKMKISHRLILGFSLILFVMAVVIVTGIETLKKTQAEQKMVVLYEIARIQLANDMIVHAQGTALDVRAILLLAYGKQPKENIRQAQNHLAETRKTYSASYAGLKKLCLLEGSLGIQCNDDSQFAGMETLADSARRLQDIGIELALAGRMADATAAITGEAFPVVQRWIQITEDMINTENKRNALAYDQAQKRYVRMRTFMLAVGALALALALALSLALARSITVPLKVAARLVLSRDQNADLSGYKEGREELGDMILAFSRNNAERIQAEEALHDSEQDFTKMFEKANDGMFVADLETKKLVFGNSACLKMLGLTQEEFMDRDLSDIHPPEELPIIFQKIEKFMRGENEIRMDCRFKHKDGTQLFTDLSPTPINYKGKKSILITFKDITERKRAEEALRANQEQLNNAMDIAHLSHWEYDVIKDVFTFNDHFYKMLRTTAEKAGGYTMRSADYARRFVHPDDASMVGEEVRKAIETTSPSFSNQLEHRIIYDDGSMGYITVKHFAVKDSHNRTIKTYGVNQDITERKRAEETLRKSEEKYRLITENTADVITVMDLNLKITYVSPSIIKIRGYTVPEAMTQSLEQIFLPGSLLKIKNTYAEQIALETGGKADPQRTITMELEEYCQDGSEIWVEITLSFLRDSSLNPIGIVSVTRNITKRKRAERELSEAKALVEAVVENLPHMVFLKEAADLRFVMFNRAGEDLLGYDRKDLMGKNNLDLFPPEQAAHFMAKDREVLDGAEGVLDIPEEPIQTAKKGQRLLHTRKVCIRGADGTTKYLLGISEDITERKLSEEALRTSEDKYRMLAEHQGEGIVIADFEEQITYGNPAAEAIIGVPTGTLAGRRFTEFISLGSAERLSQETGRRKQGEKSKYELEILRPDDERRTLMVTAVPQLDATGQPSGTLAILQDFTEQKRAEKLQAALYYISESAAKTENLQSLYRIIHDAVKQLINTSNFYIALYDEKDQMISFPYYVDEIDPPGKTRKMGDGITDYVLRTGVPLLTTPDNPSPIRGKEFTLVGTASVEWAGVPMKVGGRTIGALVVQTYSKTEKFGKDALEILGFMSENIAQVIERKEAEDKRKKLMEELRKLSAAVEQSANVVVITDLNSDIIYVNQAFSDLTGYTREEAIGQNPRILKSGEMDASAYQQMWQVLTSGGRWQGEFHNKKKNGELFWEQSTITSIRDEQGKPAFYMAVKEDITMRRALEEERERLIAELQNSLDNIKTLRGLVPICASCKKIRNDGGYWQQVEEYVAEHTEADFSHGLCDECAHKLYPDYFPDKQNEPPK